MDDRLKKVEEANAISANYSAHDENILFFNCFQSGHSISKCPNEKIDIYVGFNQLRKAKKTHL